MMHWGEEVEGFSRLSLGDDSLAFVLAHTPGFGAFFAPLDSTPGLHGRLASEGRCLASAGRPTRSRSACDVVRHMSRRIVFVDILP